MPVVECPKCQNPYMNLGALQRHAKLAHGINSSELNELCEEPEGANETKTKSTHSLKKEKKRKRAKNSQETDKSSSEIEESEKEARKEGNSSNILYESMKDISPVISFLCQKQLHHLYIYSFPMRCKSPPKQ